ACSISPLRGTSPRCLGASFSTRQDGVASHSPAAQRQPVGSALPSSTATGQRPLGVFACQGPGSWPAGRSEEFVVSPQPGLAADAVSPSVRPLRAWQRRALTSYLTRRPKDFLAVATPGAGKT